MTVSIGSHVQLVIRGKREPRPEIGGIEERVTEHATLPGLDEHSGVAKKGYLHGVSPGECANGPHGAMERDVVAAGKQ